MHTDQGDSQPDRQPNRDRDQLQRSLEARKVGGRFAGCGLGCEGEEASVAEAGGELEEDAGDHDDEGVAAEETTVEIGDEADCECTVEMA